MEIYVRMCFKGETEGGLHAPHELAEDLSLTLCALLTAGGPKGGCSVEVTITLWAYWEGMSTETLSAGSGEHGKCQRQCLQGGLWGNV